MSLLVPLLRNLPTLLLCAMFFFKTTPLHLGKVSKRLLFLPFVPVARNQTPHSVELEGGDRGPRLSTENILGLLYSFTDQLRDFVRTVARPIVVFGGK